MNPFAPEPRDMTDAQAALAAAAWLRRGAWREPADADAI